MKSLPDIVGDLNKSLVFIPEKKFVNNSQVEKQITPAVSFVQINSTYEYITLRFTYNSFG